MPQTIDMNAYAQSEYADFTVQERGLPGADGIGINGIAEPYDSTKLYSYPMCVIYNELLLQCMSNEPMHGPPTPTYWRETTIDEVTSDKIEKLENESYDVLNSEEKWDWVDGEQTATLNGVTVVRNGKTLIVNGTSSSNTQTRFRLNGSLVSVSGNPTSSQNTGTTVLKSGHNYTIYLKLISGNASYSSTDMPDITIAPYKSNSTTVYINTLDKNIYKCGWFYRSGNGDGNAMTMWFSCSSGITFTDATFEVSLIDNTRREAYDENISSLIQPKTFPEAAYGQDGYMNFENITMTKTRNIVTINGTGLQNSKFTRLAFTGTHGLWIPPDWPKTYGDNINNNNLINNKALLKAGRTYRAQVQVLSGTYSQVNTTSTSLNYKLLLRLYAKQVGQSTVQSINFSSDFYEDHINKKIRHFEKTLCYDNDTYIGFGLYIRDGHIFDNLILSFNIDDITEESGNNYNLIAKSECGQSSYGFNPSTSSERIAKTSHNIGDLFLLGNTLRKVIAPIGQGETIGNSNIVSTTLADEIKEVDTNIHNELAIIDNDINNISGLNKLIDYGYTQRGVYEGTYARIEGTNAVINGSFNSNTIPVYMRLSGTDSDNRYAGTYEALRAFTNPITLQNGHTYRFWMVYHSGTVSKNNALYPGVYKMGDDYRQGSLTWIGKNCYNEFYYSDEYFPNGVHLCIVYLRSGGITMNNYVADFILEDVTNKQTSILNRTNGANLISVSDFVNKQDDVTSVIDIENQEITASTSARQYAVVQTNLDWVQKQLIVGHTYRLHAKAEALSGTPYFRVGFRGGSGNDDALMASIRYPDWQNGGGGVGFVDYTITEYTRRICMIFTWPNKGYGSAKFSDITLTDITDVTPAVPQPNGTYVLKATVLDGAVNYQWVAET